MEFLIPGLIDDLARECLIRVPIQALPTATSVCRGWMAEIRMTEFLRFRKLAGVSRSMIVLAQANTNEPTQNRSDDVKHSVTRPGYRLALYEPCSGSWVRLPGIPNLPEGLPMFCGVVGVGTEIVVIGGWDPVTCRASGCVYVYSFLLGTWRRGSSVPGVQRSFFGFGSDHVRTVVIAGGHDEDKNALRSALMYDVAEDKWIPLPDMDRERDECKVVYLRGMFHVVSGYPTDSQGCFERTAEAFDPVMGQWEPVTEDFLETSATPSSCVVSSNGQVYACVGRRSADVAAQLGDKWQIIAKVPADVGSTQWVATCGDKLVVIGSSKFGLPSSGYMLDLKNYKWSKINVPNDYSGLVQSGCVLEL